VPLPVRLSVRNYASAHQWSAYQLLSMGRLGEARHEIERGKDLDPRHSARRSPTLASPILGVTTSHAHAVKFAEIAGGLHGLCLTHAERVNAELVPFVA